MVAWIRDKLQVAVDDDFVWDEETVITWCMVSQYLKYQIDLRTYAEEYPRCMSFPAQPAMQKYIKP